jgi:hypothetical protein
VDRNGQHRLVQERACGGKVALAARVGEQPVVAIAALARRGLVNGTDLERRAHEALDSYVGDSQRLRGNIASALKIVAASAPTN